MNSLEIDDNMDFEIEETRSLGLKAKPLLGSAPLKEVKKNHKNEGYQTKADLIYSKKLTKEEFYKKLTKSSENIPNL